MPIILAGIVFLIVAGGLFWIGVKITSFITKLITWAIAAVLFLITLTVVAYKLGIIQYFMKMH
jgi:C4-dicarboxylate transporter